MTTAVQHLRSQKRLARRADRVARDVLRAVRSDPALEAMGLQFKKPGEELTAADWDGLQVYWVSLGGQVDPTRVVTRETKAPRDAVGFHVEEFLEKLDRATTWRTLTTLAQRQMIGAIKERIKRLVIAANPDILDGAPPVRCRTHGVTFIGEEDRCEHGTGGPGNCTSGVVANLDDSPETYARIRHLTKVAVWPKDVDVRGWVEQDGWYFHVMMRLPLGALSIANRGLVDA